MKRLGLFLFILSLNLHAATVGHVIGVKGNAFTFKTTGEAVEVTVGMKIEDLSEILTEDGSQISFVNLHEHTFHLSGGTHVKFMNRIVEVQNGNVWVVSKNSKKEINVQSSNAKVEFETTEFIFSYDNANGKSQVLVMDGEVEFSNLLESDLKYEVGAGKFSFIDKKYEDGTPRVPTQVGFDSFKTLISNFQEIKPQDVGFEKTLIINRSQSRSVASVGGSEVVSESTSLGVKKGKITFIKSFEGVPSRAPSSVPSSAEYYDGIKKNQKASSQKKLNKISVRYFQAQGAAAPAVEMPKIQPMPNQAKPHFERVPASNQGSPASQGLLQELNNFESSLQQSQRQQQKYPDEVNSLIHELKSYQKDFNPAH